MKDHIKTLETENEAIKLFIKEQLYAIKKSISDIKNEETVNENVKLIEHLQKANEKLEPEMILKQNYNKDFSRKQNQ